MCRSSVGREGFEWRAQGGGRHGGEDRQKCSRSHGLTLACLNGLRILRAMEGKLRRREGRARRGLSPTESFSRSCAQRHVNDAVDPRRARAGGRSPQRAVWRGAPGMWPWWRICTVCFVKVAQLHAGPDFAPPPPSTRRTASSCGLPRLLTRVSGSINCVGSDEGQPR